MPKTVTALLHEDETGQLLADRNLAQALIEYGQRNERPEAIAVAVRILRSIPVDVDDPAAKKQCDKTLSEALEQASKMWGCDTTIDEMIEKARNTRTSTKLREHTPPKLSGGILLDVGASHKMTLSFPGSITACVTATADRPGQLSIDVRGERQSDTQGSTKPSPNSYSWDTGTRARLWYIVVTNDSYGPKTVTIESNSTS